MRRLVRGMLDGYGSMYTAEGRQRWIAKARAGVFKDEPALAARVYENYRRLKLWPRRTEPVTKAQWESRVLFWLAGDVVESVPSFERVWDLSLWRAAARG